MQWQLIVSVISSFHDFYDVILWLKSQYPKRKDGNGAATCYYFVFPEICYWMFHSIPLSWLQVPEMFQFDGHQSNFLCNNSWTPEVICAVLCTWFLPVKHRGLIFAPIKSQEQVHQNHQWEEYFFSVTEKITVLENLHKVCDDSVSRGDIL